MNESEQTSNPGQEHEGQFYQTKNEEHERHEEHEGHEGNRDDFFGPNLGETDSKANKYINHSEQTSNPGHENEPQYYQAHNDNENSDLHNKDFDPKDAPL